MSDKPLKITVSGSREGYGVTVELETTLDKVPAIIKRLQANGIDPLPTPAGGGGSKGNGSKAQQQTIEGKVTQVLTSKDTPRGKLVKLQMSTTEKEYQVVTAFSAVAGAMVVANVNVGDHLQVGGYVKSDEHWGDSFIVQTWKRLKEAA